MLYDRKTKLIIYFFCRLRVIAQKKHIASLHVVVSPEQTMGGFVEVVKQLREVSTYVPFRCIRYHLPVKLTCQATFRLL